MTTLYIDEGLFTSEYAAGFRDFARCSECQARSASEHERQSLIGEGATHLQWIRCAQCRSGVADWYRPR